MIPACTVNAAPGPIPARILRVQGQSSEPVTLGEAKAWLAESRSTHDELIGALIKAARERCEDLTGLALMQSTWEAQWDALPRAGTFIGAPLSRSLELPVRPLKVEGAVTWLRYLDAEHAEHTISADDYRVYGAGQWYHPGGIELDPAANWPDVGTARGALRCRFIAGPASAATVPAQLKVWIKQTVKLWYDPGRSGVNIGSIVNGLPDCGPALLAGFVKSIA